MPSDDPFAPPATAFERWLVRVNIAVIIICVVLLLLLLRTRF